MKKVLILAIVALIAYIAFMPTHNVYTVHASVYEADYTERTMVFVDERGQAWSVIDEPFIYKPGTQVILTMDGHGNQWLIDDEILCYEVL